MCDYLPENAEKSRYAKKIAVFVKKTAENFAESENSSTFAAVLRMSCGVMVARRILVPPVRVRILPGQQKLMGNSTGFPIYFFTNKTNLN